MSPERFLEQFGYLAEAPNGIAKLRELVLYLAVRGKLVPQDPVEDSAHEALKRARALLGAAAAAKRRSSWKTSKPFSPAEKLPSVPSNWCWARVNDTGFYTNGLAFKPSDWKDRGLPIIRIQNLTDSTKPFNFAQGDFPDEVLVRQGDLLVSWSATLDVFSWQLRDAVLNQHIFLVQPCSLLVDKGFLYWLLKNAIREMAESEHAHGLVMTHINRGPFLAHPVAIPPLAEQQRIVAKVDQLMTLCDELEAKQNQRAETHVHLIRAAHHPLTQPRDHAEFRAAWRRIRDNFDRLHTTIDAVKALRQSILQLAVQGKLVPQDPNDEPASVLLEKIRAEKERLIAAGKIKRTKPLPSIAQEGVAFDAPQGWKWTRLGLVGLCATGKTPDTRNPDYYGGSTPFIGPGQITEDSRVLTAEKWVSESGKSETSIASTNDVLMVCIGGSIGKCAVVEEETAFNQQINSVKPIFANPSYLHAVLKSPFFQSELLAKASGSATPIINRTKWEGLPVSLPPVAEQHRIVAKVDQLMALCDELEAKIKTNQTTAEHFAEAVVAELAA